MRILFLTHRLPYAPNRGDRNRAYHLMQEMSRFAEVSLFSLVHDAEEASHVGSVPFAHDVTTVRVPKIRNLLRGAASLASKRPLTHSLLDAPDAHSALTALVRNRPPDLAVAFCSGMARFCLQSPLNEVPLVLDMVDVDSAKWRQVAARSHGPWRWIFRREERTLSAFEARATRAAFATLVVNERERAMLLTLAPEARVLVVQNGIDVEAFRPTGPPATEPIVIFCGVMNYFPNEEGVRWFGEQVWPHVRAARPDARFVIVGSSPTRAVRQLAARDSSIEVVGRVPAVQPYLHRAAVSVAPLRLARGIQTKVIEALAAGLPVVVTAEVLQGLPREAEGGCLTAGAPETFAQAVVTLLGSSAGDRRRKASSASLEALTWEKQLRALPEILAQAATHHRRPQPGDFLRPDPAARQNGQS